MEFLVNIVLAGIIFLKMIVVPVWSLVNVVLAGIIVLKMSVVPVWSLVNVVLAGISPEDEFCPSLESS